MTPPPRPAPSHVPTLTEVIELPGEPPLVPVTDGPPPVAAEALVPPVVQGDVAPVQTPAAPLTSPVPQAPPSPPVDVAAASVAPMPVPQPPVAVAPMPLSPVSMPSTPAAMAPPVQPLPAAALQPSPFQAATALPPKSGGSVDEAAMAQRVLAEVQRQIDGMLEYRLREALTPILARTSESLVRELRQELSKTMRDVVSRAVAQEVARARGRS